MRGLRTTSTADHTDPDTAAAADLPAGYDDPQSDYFVPPELRDAYTPDLDAEARELVPTISLATGTMTNGPIEIAHSRELARRWAALRAAEPNSRHYPADASMRDMRQWVAGPSDDPLPTSATDEDERLWRHLYRLGRARTATEAAAEQAANQARWNAGHTCATCGEVTAGVENRDIHGAPMLTCRPCSIVLAAAAVQQLAQQRLDDGRTRGQAVRDYLDLVGAPAVPTGPDDPYAATRTLGYQSIYAQPRM